ncbi:TetR/AcrR family transcriptional regulator [Planctomonas deserti]|uniref:TetR/AcrR family transcriptional regulator n=1 Tax=Planctomonas deserti TaxID=2144185 RepID=UPI000D337A78|nr:TetR/AcrR family transcriptional regulator [Planctomonas deserti]
MSSPAPERAPRKDAAENRAAILRAAAQLLNYDPDASLEAIAAAAGLSRRALYGHFATRDDLLRELVVIGAARITTALPASTGGDSRLQLAIIGARLWDEVEHVRVMARVAVRGPLAPVVADALEPLRRTLREVIEQGVRAGELRQDIDAPTLARLVEGAALTVLDEAARGPLSRERGRQLVVLGALGMCGLDWREADRILTALNASAPDAGTSIGSGTGDPGTSGAGA